MWTPTGRANWNDLASRRFCPLPLRGDMRPNGLLGSREARRVGGEKWQSSAGDGLGLCSARGAPGTWGCGTRISRGFF